MFKKISAKNKLASLCKTLGLCLMSMCMCVSAAFCMPKSKIVDASSGVSQPATLTAGSKVYFGEYPQDTVIKVNDWTTSTLTWSEGNSQSTAEITKPSVVDANSVVVHTKIKNMIEKLLQEYYSVSHTVDGETTPVMSDYKWHSTTYGYFAPKEDYSNDEISYDNSTGYYTLLKSVSEGDVAYSAGSKFHAYNRFVDSVNKLYKVKVGSMGRDSNGKTLKGKTVYLTSNISDESNLLTTGVDPNDASINYFSSARYIGDRGNSYPISRNELLQVSEKTYYDINNVVALHGYDKWVDASAKDEAFDLTGTGPDGIFLYEVKPIEWTVVTPKSLNVEGSSESGNYVTLVTSQIIDSNSFNYYAYKITGNSSIYYGRNFDNNSILKGWLNGYETSTINCSGTSTAGTEDVFYHSNRTFMDLAFSNVEDDLQTFSHTSSVAAKVGLMSWSEVEGNNAAECYKTQFALANGDQGSIDETRWLLDDSENFAVYYNRGWGTYYQNTLEYMFLGVRPMICVDLSTFGATEKVGDIAAGETLNISSPLSLGGEVDLTNASYTTPNLLHVKTENVVSGELVVNQKGSDGETGYGSAYNVSATDFVVSVGGENVPALSGFVVAGIRIYQTDDTHNIITDPTYDVKFVPITSYLGASGTTSNVISNLSGQFVMTFYLVWRGDVYLIPAECVTNPTIYVTTGTSANSEVNYYKNSGRNPEAPVNVEVAKRMAGNDMDVDVGHMSTLAFSGKVEANATYKYQYNFKYPVVFQSKYTDAGYSFQVSETAGEITFKNIIFDGQDKEYKYGFVLINNNASARFEDCVIKNVVNGNANGGGALRIAANATVNATTLEVSNCSAQDGGGVWCGGTLTAEELILTNNTAAGSGGGMYVGGDGSLNIKSLTMNNNSAQQNGGGMYVAGGVDVVTLNARGNFAANDGSSIYAATTAEKSFKVTGSLTIEGDTGKVTESGTVYSNSTAYFYSYELEIKNPIFKGNETFNASPLYLEKCNAIIGGSETSKGLFEGNISHGEGGAAAVYIKEDGSEKQCSFSWINFVNNSDKGFGAVRILGTYQSENDAVSFDNCLFSGNEGLYSGALSIVSQGASDDLSGKIKISNTTFAQNRATSTSEDDMAGALLVNKQNVNSTSSLVLELKDITFVGNVSSKFGVAKLLLGANDSVSLSGITLGGEILDGNSLDAVRNVSTLAGALFAISGAGSEPTTISVENFVARNNVKKVDSSDVFANAGVLQLDNVKGDDDILIKNSQFVATDGVSNGGAVIIKDSSGSISNSYFEENKIYVTGNNKAAVGGGAVYLSGATSSQNVNIISSTFANNSVVATGTDIVAGGGAVMANNVVLTLTNVLATDNAVTGGNITSKGGVIYSFGHKIDSVEYITKCQHTTPTLTISGGYFEGNQVKSSTPQGGAIWAECAQIVSGGQYAGVDKTTYSAGFVGTIEKTQIETGNQAKFHENKTLGTNGLSFGEGGAIYTAICFEISNEDSENIVAHFENNISRNGGAVKAKGVATIDGATFEGNSVLSDSGIGYGGAISFGNSEKTIKFSDYLQNSTATQGTEYALPMFAKIVLATFGGNQANFGGAIYSDSVLSHGKEQVFAKYSRLQIVGKNAGAVKFSSNVVSDSSVAGAKGTGGAVYAMSPVEFDMITFENNTANLCSAIYLSNEYNTFEKSTKSYIASDKFAINNATFAGNISDGSGVIGAGSYVDVTIKNSTFDGNKNQGAILQFSVQQGALGDGTLENCTFTNNINNAESYSGDVVSVAGREVAINACTFGQNGDLSKDNFGTAIIVEKDGMVYLNNISATGTSEQNITHKLGFVRVNVGGNLKIVGGEIGYLKNIKTATSSSSEIAGGGAVVVLGNASFDGINIHNCSAANGGAIYVASGGSLSFAGVISNCNATANGGGIYVESGALAQIAGKLKLDMKYSQCLIDSCSAENGGGVFGNGEVIIANAAISNNFSSSTQKGYGGGIYSKDGSLTLQKGTKISGNLLRYAGSFGGGIYAEGYLRLEEAEISNNGAADGIESCIGGGLYATDVTFDALNATFESNKAASGGGVFLSNSVVNWTECQFNSNSATNGGAMYLQDCQSSIQNSSFLDNSATGVGRAVTANGGNIDVESSTFEDKKQPEENSVAKLYVTGCSEVAITDCDFAESTSPDQKSGKVSHVKIEATDSVEIIDCNFRLGNCAGEESSVEITAPNVWVEGCLFDKNSDGGLSLKANYGIVSNSKFLSNKKNGGLKLAPYSVEAKSSVEIIDAVFANAEGLAEGNVSVANGGAIYVGKDVNLRLSGDVEVTKNESTSGGAIYVADGGKLVITRGSKIVVAGNISGDNASNLLFADEKDTAFLEGGLLDGSSIGLSLTTGTKIASNPNALPLESADVDKLFCDGADKFLSYSGNIVYCYSQENNNGNIVSKEFGGLTYSIILSDISLLYSNMPQGGYVIDKSYFKVTAGDNAVGINSISFSVKKGGEEDFSAEQEGSVTISQKGSYTLKFTINNVGENIDGLNLQGEINVTILGEYLYIISTPQAVMTAKNASSFKIVQAGSVVRSNGQEVAGTWGLISPENVTKSGYYACKFTPKQTSLYENRENVLGTMYVDVVFDKLYYNGEGKIFADAEGKVKVEAESLADALKLLADNGTMIFASTYVVSANKTITLSKKINFVRQNSTTDFAIIEVQSGGSLDIVCAGGQAIFEGQNDSINYPIFVIDGKLVLGDGVTIRNFSMSSSSSHGVVNNRGTLVLNGCTISNNTLEFVSSGASSIGGVVYNAGTMEILGGKFDSNKATNSNGGFVYNAGKLIVSGGNISNNTSGYGAGVYVANGGSAVLAGGVISHNFAQNDGGGVYVEAGGKVSLLGSQILSNTAQGLGAGLFNAEGGIVVLSSGEEVLTSTIESVEILNPHTTTTSKSAWSSWVTIVCCVLMVLATALFVFVMIKFKGRFSNDVK